MPQGPLALPGTYSVRLTWGGRTYARPLIVKMDPRVKTAQAGLAAQFAFSQKITVAMRTDYDALKRARDKSSGQKNAAADDLDSLNGDLAALLESVDGADAWPTTQQQSAFASLEQRLSADLKKVDGAR